MRLSALILLSFLLLQSGCTKPDERTYPVRGVVRFPDGRLLRRGSIEFEYLDGSQPHTATAEIQPDGSFTLGTWKLDDGAIAGKYRAIVIADHVIGTGFERPGLIPESPIDPKFSEYRTSGLEFVVESKTNNIVINVDYPRKADDDDDKEDSKDKEE